jgi:pimeloyl-ACP methyl ester carboxylesterase
MLESEVISNQVESGIWREVAMAFVDIQGQSHSYKLTGTGPPLVFIHGAFVDAKMWDPQVEHFRQRFSVLRYDLRGHGLTGPSSMPTYSIQTFATDLDHLLGALAIENPIVCGLSLGGMIAQAYAVEHCESICALILADTAVSVSLTLNDKLQRYILAPRWAMLAAIRLMSAATFTRFSFWLARVTRSEDWFGRDEGWRSYVEERMLNFSDAEYLKIYDAIYRFQLLPLEKITCPTLVLNGEFESKSVFRHTQEILRRVPGASARIVPGAGHTSSWENAQAFNQMLDDFFEGG